MSPPGGQSTFGNKKYLALMLVLIILLAAIGGIMYRPGKEKAKPQPSQSEFKYPFLDCQFGCNMPISIKPRASAETHVAINPKDPNNIVTSSNDLNNPSQDVWLHYYTTFDAGETWSDGIIPGYRGSGDPSILTGMGTACDPALAFDNDNNVYLAGVGYNRHQAHFGRATLIFVARSSNGGASFDTVSQVHGSFARASQFNDKEWIATDLSNGNVYVVWTIFTANLVGQIVFSRSTDHGRTWTFPTKLADIRADINAQGSFIQVDRNSTIHVVWRDFTDDTIHYTRSKDYGDSWDPVRDIIQMDAPPTPLPNGTYRVPTMPTMAIDNSDGPYGGSVYVTWQDDRFGDADIMLAFSRDWGDTWNESYIRVNNDTEGNGANQFFPAIAVSPQGWVHITFMDKRYDPNMTFIGMTYAVSTDGGQNFSINLNISEAVWDGDLGGKSNWAAITGDNSGFVGDYIGIAVTNDTAYCIWGGDTRNAGDAYGNSDIYGARVIFSGADGDVDQTYASLKEGSN